MHNNKQLAINLFAQITTFFITLGISFFLSPFIVKNLDVDGTSVCLTKNAKPWYCCSKHVFGFLYIIDRD